MDSQTLINIVVGLAAFFGGIWVKSLSESMKEMRITDSVLADKVQNIEVLVAGHYAKREDVDNLSKALFQKLDRIEAKIDLKADRA